MNDKMTTIDTMFTLTENSHKLDNEFGKEEPSTFNESMVDADTLITPVVFDTPPTDFYCIDENRSLPQVISPICEIDDISITENLNKLGIRLKDSPPHEKSTPMSEWNDQWIITLKNRKKNEESLKMHTIEAAKEDIIRFQTDQKMKRIAKKEQNRTVERDKLVVIEADLESQNPWNNVVKLVELTQDNMEHSLDCATMRNMLITLKNNE